LSSASFDGVDGLELKNSTIVAGYGSGVTVGASVACADPSIHDNTISGIRKSNAQVNCGIDLGTVDGAAIETNTISRLEGQTGIFAIRFGAGTLNTAATGNDVSSFAASPDPISYATGQGNSSTGNTGSADQTG
jgi:hypothetical protein